MAPKIALLIDAENISHKYLPRILEEIAPHGQIVLRAAYADWQIPALLKWHDIAVANNFKIRHQSNVAKEQELNNTSICLI